MTDFCFYADPDDGPSSLLIPIISRQFPSAILCTTFSDVKREIAKPGTRTVLMLPRQSGLEGPVELTKEIWLQEIRLLTSKNIQLVLFLPEIEFINQDNEWLSQLSNLTIVTPAQHNFGQFNYPWITWQHWLQDAADVYQQSGMAEYIDTLDNTVSPKFKLFDVLLGGQRPYRTRLHNWIQEDPILSVNSIMSYYGGTTAGPKILLEPGMDADKLPTPLHAGYLLQFQGVSTRMGVVPPVSIYQQAAYSIVTETTALHDYAFFTEKIARPIVCQRLFIVLAGYRYLHYLRNAGFQTFNSIINESYDLEVDNKKRWRMAFEQMQKLAAMDQQQVLEHIRPIVKHNRQVLLGTDWHKKMSQQVRQILDSRLQLNLKES